MRGAFTHLEPPSSSGFVAVAIAFFVALCDAIAGERLGGGLFEVLRSNGSVGRVPGRDGGSEVGSMMVAEDEERAPSTPRMIGPASRPGFRGGVVYFNALGFRPWVLYEGLLFVIYY